MAVIWFNPVHDSRQHKHLDEHDGVLCYGHAIQPHVKYLRAFINAGSGHSGPVSHWPASAKVQQRRLMASVYAAAQRCARIPWQLPCETADGNAMSDYGSQDLHV